VRGYLNGVAAGERDQVLIRKNTDTVCGGNKQLDLKLKT
jgi:hypothetical protein